MVLVNFKEGKVWTASRKHDLIADVVSGLPVHIVPELFGLLQIKFNTTSVALTQKYYSILREEPEAVRGVLAELDAHGTPYANPYSTDWHRSRGGKKVNVEAVVSAKLEAAAPAEDKVLLSASRLIEGISRLKDLDTSSFLDGLAVIVNKANHPEDKAKDAQLSRLMRQNKELTDKNSELENQVKAAEETSRKLSEENAKIKEDLEVVSAIIDRFNDMNAAGKLANVNLITRDLKVTVDNCGCVVKVKPAKD